jgi:hypothetical protein
MARRSLSLQRVQGRVGEGRYSCHVDCRQHKDEQNHSERESIHLQSPDPTPRGVTAVSDENG